MSIQDNYIEQYLNELSRINKRLTRTVFRNELERKLFLKIFSKMQKKMKRSNQFEVAIKLKNYFKDGKKEGLFDYLYVSEWNINQSTGLYERNDDQIKKSIFMVDEQKRKRCEFLLNIGFSDYLSKNQNYFEIFKNDVFYRYFLIASPEAIVQMKKRISKK